jgi:hypothetical protein
MAALPLSQVKARSTLRSKEGAWSSFGNDINLFPYFILKESSTMAQVVMPFMLKAV